MKKLNYIDEWEQLPEETSTAYYRFSIYLELGADRSIREVGEKLGKSKGYEKQLEKWSSKYHWVKRASAYDRHCIRKSLNNRQEIIDTVMSKMLAASEEVTDGLLEIAKGEKKFSPSEADTLTQRLKAIESILDRIGVPKQKEIINTGEEDKGATLYQQINNYILNRENGLE